MKIWKRRFGKVEVGKKVKIVYTNWRRKTAIREIIPKELVLIARES
jgi:hypothetical protein